MRVVLTLLYDYEPGFWVGLSDVGEEGPKTILSGFLCTLFRGQGCSVR